MSEDGTRASVRARYDAYERRDFERVGALIHDDIDWMIYAPVLVFPFAGPRRGKAAVLEALAAIAETFALKSCRPEIVIVDGARAAVIGSELRPARHRPHAAVPDRQFPELAGRPPDRVPRIHQQLLPVEQALGRELQF